MEKIITLCCTPFQILIAVALKLDLFKDDEFDIAISDDINDYQTIIDNIEKINLFSRVIPIEERKYKIETIYKGFRKVATLNRNLSRMFTNKYYKDIGIEYDQLFFYNIAKSDFLWNIFAYAQKKHCKLNWFEEGISINFPYLKTFFESRRDNCFHYHFLQNNISYLYCVKPDKLAYQVPFKKKELTFPSKNEKYIEYINTIFNYSQDDFLNQKYIFFDQNLLELRTTFDKIKVLETIKEKVGKDNLLVKLHPRNNTPEYNEKFNVMKKTNIPWEVFLLNQKDIKDKVLIGLSSIALLHPNYYFGVNMRVISLIKMMEPEFQETEINSFIIKEYFNKNKDLYKCPTTLDELVGFLE